MGSARRGQTILTLVVDANVDTFFARTENVGAVCDGSETTGVGRLNPQLANLSVIPASTLTVAKLLDNVIVVKVVYANLPSCPSGRVPVICEGLAHLSPITVGDRGKRTTTNGAEVKVVAGPYTV